MPELQIDVTVANRFISSLSKSLQALCHGCMDFDSGIEIVGYINVNIDSGNKVDYVLNEKVLKSTTNSMTFVSNSFLAKKEQQKQTRDGCCSPIPQTQGITSYPSRMRGPLHSSQYHRTASQYSSHSQVPGASQKRPRTDDWRLSPKRHRIQNLPAETQSFTDQNSLPSHSSLLSPSAGHTYSDTSFKQPQLPASTGTVDSTLLLQMNIKKEVLEADNHSAVDAEHMTSEDQSDDQTYDSSYETSKMKIKSDPDDTKSDNEETAPTDTSNVANSENTDFKGTFLEPSSPNDTQPTDEGNNESDNQLPAFEQRSKSSSKDKSLRDEVNVASTSAANLGDSGSGVSADNEPTSDVPIEYDQAAEDSSYSQSAYDDAGEGSSDAGQFEVIEIDDEDEDVQAMFGDAHSAHSPFSQPLDTSRPHHHHHNVALNTSYSAPAARLSRNKQEQKESYFVFDPSSQMYMCPACGKEYKSSSGARLHYKIKHCGAFDHYCQACGKGFQQKSHLKAHMSLHMQQKNFECSICGSQYAHKTSLTAHQKLAHGASL